MANPGPNQGRPARRGRRPRQQLLEKTNRPDTRTEVNQATGMLAAQLKIEPTMALARLRTHAYATYRTPTDVARDILARRLPLPTTGP
jgi:hypothetical protein